MRELLQRHQQGSTSAPLGSRMSRSLPSNLANNDYVINSSSHDGAQEEQQLSSTSRRVSGDGGGPSRRQIIQDRVAVFRSPRPDPQRLQQMGTVDGMQSVCPSAPICFSGRRAELGHEGGEPHHRPKSHGAASDGPEGALSRPDPHEDGHRDGVCQALLRAAPSAEGRDPEPDELHCGASYNTHCGQERRLRDQRPHGQPERCGNGGRLRWKADGVSGSISVQPRDATRSRRRLTLPEASSLASAEADRAEHPHHGFYDGGSGTSRVTSMSGRPWASPGMGKGSSSSSPLAKSCTEAGIPYQGYNRENGYDFYKQGTYLYLKEMFIKQKPQKLWVSPTADRWLPWQDSWDDGIHPHQDVHHRQRQERTILKSMCGFLLWCIDQNAKVDIHWEWPAESLIWRDSVLEEFSHRLWERGKNWLCCRVDGCRYDLCQGGDGQPKEFVNKKWMIRTTCPRFHAVFKTKVCVQDHQHGGRCGSSLVFNIHRGLQMLWFVFAVNTCFPTNFYVFCDSLRKRIPSCL